MRNRRVFILFFPVVLIQSIPTVRAQAETDGLRLEERPVRSEILPQTSGRFVFQWRDLQGAHETICQFHAGHFICAASHRLAQTPDALIGSEPGAPTTLKAMGEAGGVLTLRHAENGPAITALYTDREGETVWDDPDLLKNQTGEIRFDTLAFVPAGHWIFLWRQPSGGTLIWKGQEIEPSGQRDDASDGVTLHEAGSEAEPSAAVVNSRGTVALAWLDTTATGNQVHLLEWKGALQAAGVESVQSAPAASDLLRIIPLADGKWAVVWASVENGWTLRASVLP